MKNARFFVIVPRPSQVVYPTSNVIIQLIQDAKTGFPLSSGEFSDCLRICRMKVAKQARPGENPKVCVVAEAGFHYINFPFRDSAQVDSNYARHSGQSSFGLSFRSSLGDCIRLCNDQCATEFGSGIRKSCIIPGEGQPWENPRQVLETLCSTNQDRA